MKNSFGEFLRQNRIEKKLTQKELAKALFVTESAISKWERNVAYPDISLISKLSEILGVTEHELITACIDKRSREDKKQAKKWRALTRTWDLFFYISYLVTVLTCFICNLAVNGKLSWFWIVLSALLLAFTFTNLPQLIKSHKLIFIPLSTCLALFLLLGVIAIYTKGNWFFIASLSVLLGLVIIFAPICISKLKILSKIKRFNAFASIGIDFILLNILLIVIYSFTISNGHATNNWYLQIALPTSFIVYVIINILICTKFIKVNNLIRTFIILTLVDLFLYVPQMFIKSKNTFIQAELIDNTNILKADFSVWNKATPLNNNIHCIIFLTILALSIIFLIFGLIKRIGNKNEHRI